MTRNSGRRSGWRSVTVQLISLIVLPLTIIVLADSAVELALYRIVQEALSNIARHSEASHASVILSFVPKGIKIFITDYGKGFHVPDSRAEFPPGGHFGLLGMYERAELIGGTMQVQSSPGEGTRLTVEFLMDKQKSERGWFFISVP